MLPIIGVVLLLIVGAGLIAIAVVLFMNGDPFPGCLGVILALLLLFMSYVNTYDEGHGIPANPNALNKKIIYMFMGKVESGTNENIAILKDARGTIICIKTSAVLPPGTDYVKRAALTDDKVELVPVIKTSEKTPEE